MRIRRDRTGERPDTLPCRPQCGAAPRTESTAALGKLPEHQRLALVLYHFEDLSYEEIAAKLGASLAKIKTDIRRARARCCPSSIERHRRRQSGKTEMTTNESHEALERLLDRSLHELPFGARPDARITGIRELERPRRASLVAPQLRPLAAARTSGPFLVICAALIRVAFLGGAPRSRVPVPSPGLRELGGLTASPPISSPCSRASSRRPGFDAGVALCAVLYAVLFGLGAAVYRARLPSASDGQ